MYERKCMKDVKFSYKMYGIDIPCKENKHVKLPYKMYGVNIYIYLYIYMLASICHTW